MHRTLQAIKVYTKLAGTVARTAVWAFSVSGRNALRGLGHGIRNTLSGRKDGQVGEPSRNKWVIGYEPAGGEWVTIGFIATRWDEAPKVGIATTYFALRLSRIQAREQGETLSEGQLAFMLEQALRANLQVDDLGQFAAILTDFLSRDKILSDGVVKGHSGFLITLKMGGGKYRLRVSHGGPEHAVLRLMNEIENMSFDYGHDHIPEQLMYAFDFRPEDELITGRVEVQDGVATMEGRSTITLAKDGWLGTSALTPHPEMFPPPKRQRVSRYPASVLD
jgi:hypothetical protein